MSRTGPAAECRHVSGSRLRSAGMRTARPDYTSRQRSGDGSSVWLTTRRNTAVAVPSCRAGCGRPAPPLPPPPRPRTWSRRLLRHSPRSGFSGTPETWKASPPQLAAPSSLPFEMLTPTPPAHSPTTPPTNTALTPPAPAQAARVGEPNAAAAALRAYAEGKAELDGLRKELNVFRQVRTPTPCFPPPPGLHLVTIAAFHHPPACT